MEREKEEIQKKVCIACGKCKELKGDCYLAKNIATVLMADNYSKVPAGAIVLTKEEYEHLQSVENDLQRYAAELYSRARKAEYGIKQSRKETAREIYRELMGHGTTYVKKWIIEHYGVEVE